MYLNILQILRTIIGSLNQSYTSDYGLQDWRDSVAKKTCNSSNVCTTRRGIRL